MITYDKYVFRVLVPHVVVTAIIFWGMVLAWIVGWLPFDQALLIAIIAVGALLLHGAAVAVWSVSAASKEKTQIDASQLKPVESAAAPLSSKVITAEIPKVEPKTPSITVVDRAAQGISANPPSAAVSPSKTRPVVVKFEAAASEKSAAAPVDVKPTATEAQEPPETPASPPADAPVTPDAPDAPKPDAPDASKPS